MMRVGSRLDPEKPLETALWTPQKEMAPVLVGTPEPFPHVEGATSHRGIHHATAQVKH
jgi:hypothetical protein